MLCVCRAACPDEFERSLKYNPHAVCTELPWVLSTACTDPQGTRQTPVGSTARVGGSWQCEGSGEWDCSSGSSSDLSYGAPIALQLEGFPERPVLRLGAGPHRPLAEQVSSHVIHSIVSAV